jgi:hypothetical protein
MIDFDLEFIGLHGFSRRLGGMMVGIHCLRLLCISAHQAAVLPTAGPRFSGSSDAPPPADNRLVVMRDFFASAVVQRMRPSRKPKIANCIAALHIRVR